MPSLTNRLDNALYIACMGFINSGVSIKRGVMAVGEFGSRALYDIYSLDGFEKWSKALIADLKMLSLIPSIKGVFAGLLKTLDGQKDVYYGTLIIGSMADFVKVRDNGSLCLTLPKEQDGKVDWVKILYGIGNIFETGHFLQKYQVMDFPLCSKWAHQIGSFKVGRFGTCADIPVVNCWTDKPKDFFIFFASLYVTIRCVFNPYSKKFVSIENLAKLVGGIGKMVLISVSEFMSSKRCFWSLAIIDVVTQNASLIGFIWKRHCDRENRFKNPTNSR